MNAKYRRSRSSRYELSRSLGVMASRGPRSRYYPGANSLTLFSAQGSNPLEDCKVYGKGVQKVYDKSVKGYVYSISGGLQSKLQLPKHDSKAGLQLLHHFLVFQVFVPPGQHFSVELRVSDTKNTRRKMYFSTSFSDLKTTPLHCQIPISVVIRNKWLSLSFHVADLFNSCFRGGVSFRSIDIIVLGPVCKIRKIFTMRCRITETSPHGYFEESSEYCLPQDHLYAVGVDSCVQILDIAALQSAELHTAEANVEDSRLVVGPESERSTRKGNQGKTENSRIVHVAFGTRMPLPLSTVQINTSLPHDNKCPPYPKERNGRQLPNESVLLYEPKPIPNMVTRALSAATTHHETEGFTRKVDKVLTDCKITRVTQHHGSGPPPSVPCTEDKDPATSPRATVMEAERSNQDPNSQPALEPLPDSPAHTCAPTETHNGLDLVHKSPSKWQGARKRDSQTSLQAKQQRKESQARSKEYRPSRYMDSPPGSPPCGWDSTTGGNRTDDNAFNARFLEGSWINNQISEPVESGKPYCLANSLKEKLLHTMSQSHSTRLDNEEMPEAIHKDRLKPHRDHDLRHNTRLLCCEHIDESFKGGRSHSVYTDSTFGKELDGSDDERNLFRTFEVNTCDESTGRQSWSSISSDHFGEELDVSLCMSGGTSRAAAEKLGRGAQTKFDLLDRLPTPLLTQELLKKDSYQEDKLMFDPQDEILFEKLLSESKKDMHGLMNGKVLNSLTKGVEDSMDFETEDDRVRDALDFSFEETLLKMKGSRDIENFTVEPVRSAFDVDPLQSKKTWQLLSQPPVAKPSLRQTREDDEVAGFVMSKGSEDLDLLYDPTLDCYYDPKTNRYYELK